MAGSSFAQLRERVNQEMQSTASAQTAAGFKQLRERADRELQTASAYDYTKEQWYNAAPAQTKIPAAPQGDPLVTAITDAASRKKYISDQIAKKEEEARQIRPTEDFDRLDPDSIHVLQAQQTGKLREADSLKKLLRQSDTQYADTFTGQFKANYGMGRLNQDSSQAWNRYMDSPTEENRQKAQLIDATMQAFQQNNQAALDDEGAVLPLFSRSAAGYIPQLIDQTKAQAQTVGALAPIAAIPGVGTAAVAKAGLVGGSGENSYQTMRGAAFKRLVELGADEETARALANDEGFVSSLIEMGDTAVDIATLGGGTLINMLAGEGSKKLATEAGKKAAGGLLGKVLGYGGNILGEGIQEGLQESVSIANDKRVQTGERGKWNLVKDSVGTLVDALTGKSDEAAANRAQMLEAGKEGMKIAALMGGVQAVGNYAGQALVGRHMQTSPVEAAENVQTAASAGAQAAGTQISNTQGVGVQNAARSVTEPLRAGRVTTIQNPYRGQTPVQTRSSGVIVTVDSNSVQVAQNRINGAHGMASTPFSKGFKSSLKEAYKTIFKPAKGIPVEGMTFGGDPYTVDIGNKVLGKVINDPNLSAEKLALLDILPAIVRNGEYVGSGEYIQHGDKAKHTIRFDYFETPIEIGGKQYVAKFDVEVVPGANNYRTYQVTEIDLTTLEAKEVGPAPTLSSNGSGPSVGSASNGTKSGVTVQDGITATPERPSTESATSEPYAPAAADTSTVRPGRSEPALSVVDDTITQVSDSVNTGDPLLKAIFGGKRMNYAAMTAEQFNAARDVNRQAGMVRIAMDANGDVYLADPEQHIDRRTMENTGNRRVNAFQFDHPELHEFYVKAAESILRDAETSLDAGMSIRKERTMQGNRRVQEIAETPHMRAAMNAGFSRSDIIHAADALVKNHGQENFAAAKRLELILDDMLTNGWTDLYGNRTDANQDYIDAKSKIAGAQPAAQIKENPLADLMAWEDEQDQKRNGGQPSPAVQDNNAKSVPSAAAETTIDAAEGNNTTRAQNAAQSVTGGITSDENMARYRNDIDSVFSGTYPSSRVIEIGATPDVLQQYGAQAHPLTMTQEAAYKIAYPEGYMGGKHNLGMSVLKQLPYQIADPVAILKSNTQPDSLVILTEWKSGEDSVIIPIHLDKTGAIDIENRVASAYQTGHIQSYLGDNDSNVLYTKNNEDIHQLLFKGVQFPQSMADDVLARNSIPQDGVDSQAENSGTPDLGAANEGQFPFSQMQNRADSSHLINQQAAETTADLRGRAPAEVPTVNPDTGKNIQKTVSTILNSPLTSNEMAEQIETAVVDGKFDQVPITDKAAHERAQQRISRDGLKSVADSFLAKADMGQRITKHDMAEAIAAYNQAVESGDHVLAFELASGIADAAHTGAQVVQAMNLMNRLTPEGKLLTLRRYVDKLNDQQARKKTTRRQNANLDAESAKTNFVEERTGFTISDELASNYLMAETDAERAAAWDAITTNLAEQIPSTFREKANFWRYTSMLFNPTTHVRNSLGNAIQSGARHIKNTIGAAIERAAVRDQGQRTKAVMNPLSKADRALTDFAKSQYATDQKAAMGEGKYADGSAAGIAREIQDKRKMFKGKDPLSRVVQGVGDVNTRLLDAEDVLFNRSAYVDSFAQALKAKGITAERARLATLGAVENNGDLAGVLTAVDAARAYAIQEAQKATYRNTTALSEALAGLGHYQGDNAVKKAGSFAVDALLPFRRTPANILTTGLDYSPVGLVKSITYDAWQVMHGNMEAADMVDHLSAGLTGAGILALGAYLSAEGLLKVKAGNDKKEDQFNENMGMQDYSLQIGDMSYTLDWAVPAAMPLFAGAAIMDSFTEKGISLENFMSAIADAGTGVTNVLLETSMLSSLNDMMSNISYADNKATYITDRTLTAYAGQYIPTVGSKIASAMDDTVRRSYVEKGTGQMASDLDYFRQSVLKKTPGGRESLQPSVDLWGNEVKNGSGTADRLVQSFLSPGYFKTVNKDPVNDEIRRLADATGDRSVYPTQVDKSITYNGETINLTAEQYTKYAKATGQARYKAISSLIQNKGYKRLSDEDKAKAISHIYEYANVVGKQAVSSYKPGDSSFAKGAMKSILPIDAYTLYSVSADRDGSGSVTGVESARTLQELSGLTAAQRGRAWEQKNSETNPKKNPFTGALPRAGISDTQSIAILDRFRQVDKMDLKPKEKAAVFGQYIETLGLPPAQVQAVKDTYTIFGSYPVKW